MLRNILVYSQLVGNVQFLNVGGKERVLTMLILEQSDLISQLTVTACY
jgi:hypothetical protein